MSDTKAPLGLESSGKGLLAYLHVSEKEKKQWWRLFNYPLFYYFIFMGAVFRGGALDTIHRRYKYEGRIRG